MSIMRLLKGATLLHRTEILEPIYEHKDKSVLWLYVYLFSNAHYGDAAKDITYNERNFTLKRGDIAISKEWIIKNLGLRRSVINKALDFLVSKKIITILHSEYCLIIRHNNYEQLNSCTRKNLQEPQENVPETPPYKRTTPPRTNVRPPPRTNVRCSKKSISKKNSKIEGGKDTEISHSEIEISPTEFHPPIENETSISKNESHETYRPSTLEGFDDLVGRWYRRTTQYARSEGFSKDQISSEISKILTQGYTVSDLNSVLDVLESNVKLKLSLEFITPMQSQKNFFGEGQFIDVALRQKMAKPKNTAFENHDKRRERTCTVKKPPQEISMDKKEAVSNQPRNKDLCGVKAEDFWQEVCTEVQKEIDKDVYNNLIRPLRIDVEGNEVALLASSKIEYDTVLNDYFYLIETCKNRLGYNRVSVFIDIREEEMRKTA